MAINEFPIPTRIVNLNALDQSVADAATSAAASEAARDAAAASAVLADADATATAADRVATNQDRVQTGLDVASAAASETAAAGSATTATSAAVAASDAIGANVYNTKAAADAALAGLSNGERAQVLVDESQAGQRTLYVVTAGAFVFLRALGDETLTTIAKRDGVKAVPRFTLTTLAHFDTLALGARNVTSIPYMPYTETLSQSGTTVTAPFGRFTRDHIGAMIYWDNGEEAMIVDVPIINWPTASLTCTVDRSQTISASLATWKPKHLVGAFHGDSVGWRHAPAFNHAMWRNLGFGGTVTQANSVETAEGNNIAQVTLSGTARDATADNDFINFPWGQHWEIPASSSVTVQLFPQYLNATKRTPRHGLEPYEMAFDTAIIIWRRAAGAFTVERKRVNDAAWESVETISDASAGSTKYGFRKYTHALRHDWMYRVSTTSGTIELQSVTFRNDSQHGYVYWPVFRGGRLLSEFNEIAAADLAEISRIVGVPDFITTIAYDTVGGQIDASDYLPEIQGNRALWAAAAPYMDFVWLEGWQAATTAAEQSAWNKAIAQTAINNGDSLVSLEDFFGPFAETGFRWLEDSVHPGYTGGAVIAHRLMDTLGVFDFSSLDSGRNINAREGDFVELRARGASVGDAMSRLNRSITPERGLKWTANNAGPMVGKGAMGAALGSSDFTVSLHMTAVNPGLAFSALMCIGSDGTNVNAPGTILVFQNTTSLVFQMLNAGGSSFQIQYRDFAQIYAGQTGVLTIRSDVANARLDLFWDGTPLAECVVTHVDGGGDALGAWDGTGTDFAIHQNATAGQEVTYYHAMAWRSRLTDAQVLAVVHEDGPAGTSPDFWWDFSEGIGRTTIDKSGNGKNGVIDRGGNSYLVDEDKLFWVRPKQSSLGPTFVMDISEAVSMLPGDDVIAAFSADRDMRLPSTSSVGDVFRITVNSTSVIRITQSAGQQIKSGVSATTAGTGGSVTIPNASSVTLRCVAGGASSVWIVENHNGAALTFA